MLHPATAHFAVVLPIISLVLGMAYLIKPSELMSKVSTRFMVFATLFMIAAFFSGKHDGGEVFSLLSNEGQLLLGAHKDFGLYLVLAMATATLVKFFGCVKKVIKAEIFAVILVAIVSGGVLYQGKMGGELVYTHGAHVEKHSDGMDCLADPEDFIEDEEEE